MKRFFMLVPATMLAAFCLAAAERNVFAPGSLDNTIGVEAVFPGDAMGFFCELERVPEFVDFAVISDRKGVAEAIMGRKAEMKEYYTAFHGWPRVQRMPMAKRVSPYGAEGMPLRSRFDIIFDVSEQAPQGAAGKFTIRLGDDQGRSWIKEVALAVAGEPAKVPDKRGPVTGETREAAAGITCLPNPFTSSAVMSFSLAREGRVLLKVYNIEGRLVRTLVDGVLGAGRHQAVWNGRNDDGRQMANGVYFIRMSAEGRRTCDKILLLK